MIKKPFEVSYYAFFMSTSVLELQYQLDFSYQRILLFMQIGLESSIKEQMHAKSGWTVEQKVSVNIWV